MVNPKAGRGEWVEDECGESDHRASACIKRRRRCTPFLQHTGVCVGRERRRDQMHYLCRRKGQIILRHQPSRSRACGKNTNYIHWSWSYLKASKCRRVERASRLVVESVGVSWRMWSGSKLHKFYPGVSSETGTPMTFYRRVLIAVQLEDMQRLDQLKDSEVQSKCSLSNMRRL